MLCHRAPRQHRGDEAILWQKAPEQFRQRPQTLAAAQQAQQQHRALHPEREDRECCNGDRLTSQMRPEPRRHDLSKEDPTYSQPDQEDFLFEDECHQTEALEQAPCLPARSIDTTMQGGSPHQMKDRLPHLPIVALRRSGWTAKDSLRLHRRQQPNR